MELKKQYCTLYIVRHGEVSANVEKVVAGVTDTGLTAQGLKQAEFRGKDLSGIEFEAVFSSDLIRARTTAEIIKMERKLAVNTSKLLRERNFGAYEGRHERIYFDENRQMFEKFEKLPEQEKRKFKIYPTIESEQEMMARFIVKLRELAVTFLGKNVLVVSHGSIMRTFLIHLGYGRRDDFPWGSLSNTAYLQVDCDGVDFFIKKVVGLNKIEKKA